jgi:uncharacterized membrane protein YphA (DoxX/SURF4 family)
MNHFLRENPQTTSGILWIVQAYMAFVFWRIGLRKVMWPMERLQTRVAWTGDYSPGFVRTIGVVEIAASLGLVVPGLVGVLPMITPITAIGIGVLMILGARLHIRRKEYVDALRHEPWMFLLASLVAWGRFLVG